MAVFVSSPNMQYIQYIGSERYRYIFLYLVFSLMIHISLKPSFAYADMCLPAPKVSCN